MEQTSAKAGRRNAARDQERLDEAMQMTRSAHQAVKAAGGMCDCTDCAGEDAPPPEAMHDEMPEATAKAGAPLAVEDAPPVVASIKAAGAMTLDVVVAYGGPHIGADGKGRDSHGEYFDASTDTGSDYWPTPPAVYYHGYDEQGRQMARPDILGVTTTRTKRADGEHFTVKLKDTPRARKVYEAALRGQALASPGTIGHMRRADRDGKLLVWPIAEISIWEDDGKRQQANAYSVATAVLKASYLEAGLDASAIDDKTTAAADEPRGATAQRGDEQHAATTSPHETRQETTMTHEEIAALVAQQLAARDEQKKAEADAKAAFDAAVTAKAEELAAAKAAELKAAEQRRLPDGEGRAPYVTKFADTRKFDSLNAADQSLLVDILSDARKRGRSRDGASSAAYKALAIKYAEDSGGVGQEGQSAMKAAGLNPADALNAAKANELDYSTQAGYGDEWVGAGYSRQIWDKIRADTFVAQQIPSFEMPDGLESMTIPLESTDPTFYKVAQATGVNATTGRPDATVTSSKVATGKDQVTLAKMGARVLWSGEMEEDSLIPFVAQLRAQLEKAGAEQLEAAVIDGDTAAGATTNINDIGGTPASTDLFLLFDGLRKSPLVTTTANSYNAGGVLADSTFLEVVKLMGTAGLNGADRQKVAFIIDANVRWKALQLAAIKTQDVFGPNATILNGEIDRIYGYPVFTSYFMHYWAADRKANTAGKVDQDTTANNTTGSILAVRWDQWQMWYRRRMTVKTQELIDSDSMQIVVTARVGLVQRDTEASAIAYNVGI